MEVILLSMESHIPAIFHPSTGRGGDLRHHHGMLGPRPRGPTHRPLRRRTHLRVGGRDGQTVQPQLLGGEDPRGAEDPGRGGDPRGGGENHGNTGHHSRGLLRERREVRGRLYVFRDSEGNFSMRALTLL